MKKNLTIKAAIGIAFLISSYGCDVEQTQEGKLPDVDVKTKSGNLPKYEVVKTQDGNMPDVDIDIKGGQLPKYDVDAPNIVVGTKKMEVEVPDVDVKMKKETIEVPVVGIEMPDDDS